MTRTTQWEGKYLRMVTEGTWEFVERVGGMTAVVLLAEHDDKVILVEQFRTPLGRRCLELPAGLVGDEGDATVEETAMKELEEETGFTATGVERLGDYYSSPGMVAEGFTLVRMTGVEPGGTKSEEDIAVHLVERGAVPSFVEQCRADGLAIDVRLLVLLAADILG
jgi:ADP-ribose pyrophosphatase